MKFYLMPQRKKDNIQDIYTTIVNQYAPYMCGRRSACQRSIMANIDGVELIGENSTLKIYGLIFDNNGLTMDYTNSVENHGIVWR